MKITITENIEKAIAYSKNKDLENFKELIEKYNNLIDLLPPYLNLERSYGGENSNRESEIYKFCNNIKNLNFKLLLINKVLDKKLEKLEVENIYKKDDGSKFIFFPISDFKKSLEELLTTLKTLQKRNII